MVHIPLALSALAALLPSVHATARGLAWATNNDFAPVIGSKPMVTWYHHWEDGPVPQMPGKNEYVPMFWGAKKWSKWNARKAEMAKKTPQYLLGFNEPDISSQGDMSPAYAADVWMKEIHPWAANGVKLGSPAVAWDLDWTMKFLAELKKRGGHVDFVSVHWYGSYKDIEGFKKFVSSAHSRFGYNIWVTELGVTTGSRPTQQQTKSFMMAAYAWMDSVGFVDRASWFGCFEASSPPDSYATGKNALFKAAYTLSDMGYWYGYSASPDRRELPSATDANLKRRHQAIAARLSASSSSASKRDGETEEEDPDYIEYLAGKAGAVEEEEAQEEGGVDCDEMCEMRNAGLIAYEKEKEK
ncbi:glycosyl hydrolase catalytic core-domain-containing protein [Mycena crocata]|nr:glycosyl hydrolase catalytic core-domain-containing protein [Mycena crocata]